MDGKTSLYLILITSLISFWGVIAGTSVALSGAAYYKLGYYVNSFELGIALSCNGVTVGVSLIILFCATLPASIGKNGNTCCSPTYYISVVVAGSISVIGTTVAGILQIFAVYNYENILSDSDLSSYGRAAASLNLIASILGVIMIAIALFAAVGTNSCFCCKEDSKCTRGSITAFILVNFLLISILIAALLTIFSSFFITNYSSENGNSVNYSRALVSAFCSGGAAACLMVGFCVGGSFVCCYCKTGCTRTTTLRIVIFSWAMITCGTVVGGGLMTKVGQSFSSEETLDPTSPLNRASISAMGYFIGGLNFLTTTIAIVLCCFGVALKKEGISYTLSDNDYSKI